MKEIFKSIWNMPADELARQIIWIVGCLLVAKIIALTIFFMYWRKSKRDFNKRWDELHKGFPKL